MKILTLISVILFCFTSLTKAQVNEIATHYYFSTDDYLNGRLSESEVILVVKRIGDDYIYVKDVLDPLTRKRSKTGMKAWAIEYNGNVFMNLMYSQQTEAAQFYVMIDIKGKFCVAIMEQEFLKSLKEASPDLIMPGLLPSLAVALAESWGTDFADSTGTLKKILIVDTRQILPESKNSPGEFLNRSKLKWFLGQKQLDRKPEEYSVEEILARAEELNSRNTKPKE